MSFKVGDRVKVIALDGAHNSTKFAELIGSYGTVVKVKPETVRYRRYTVNLPNHLNTNDNSNNWYFTRKELELILNLTFKEECEILLNLK